MVADWKYEQKLFTEYDGTEFGQENQKTIPMTIMPKDQVEYMRDRFLVDKFKEDYQPFEQELFDRMPQKKLDEDHRTGHQRSGRAEAGEQQWLRGP